MVTHEIGDLFWLDDNPETKDYSLMLHGRDRESIYTPQMADIYHMEQKMVVQLEQRYDICFII